MPHLNVDMFDETPHEGDKVKVIGKIKNIDSDTGDVEVSYDDVSIVNKNKKNKSDNNDNTDNVDYTQNPDNQMMPQTQTLDSALARAFPNNQ